MNYVSFTTNVCYEDDLHIARFSDITMLNVNSIHDAMVHVLDGDYDEDVPKHNNFIHSVMDYDVDANYDNV